MQSCGTIVNRHLALQGADFVGIPTAADAWAWLSGGRLTDGPDPNVSRTPRPTHADHYKGFVPTPTSAARRQ